MAGTLIVAVPKALFAAVAALPEFSDESSEGHTPLVTRRWLPGVKAAEVVSMIGDPEFSQEPASLKAGRTFRDETARFTVEVSVQGIDLDLDATVDRCLFLGTAFEEFVADNRVGLNASVPGLKWIVAEGDGKLGERAMERGYLAYLHYSVKYNARLT